MNENMVFWAQAFGVSSLLILLALLVGRLFRRSASTAYVVLMASLLLTPIVPLVCALFQPYQISIASFQIASFDSQNHPLPLAADRPSNNATNNPKISLSHGTSTTAEANPVIIPPTRLSAPSATSQTSNTRTFDPVPQRTSTHWLSSDTSSLPTGVQRCLLFWIAGISIGMIRLVMDSFTVYRIARRSTPISPDFLGHDVRLLMQEHRIRLYVSGQINSPIAIGIGRPGIYIPTHFQSQFAQDSIGHAMLHEMAHLIRHDQRWLVLQRMLGILLWPHLLVHLLNRAIAETREDICDNFVLNHCRAVDYSRGLLKMSETLRPDASPVLVPGLFTRRNLIRRISGLLSNRRVLRFVVSPEQVIGIALTMIATCGGLALLGIEFTQDSTHHYRPEVTDGVFSPVFHSIELSDSHPDDLEIRIETNAQLRSGQIRYGSDGSTRIAIAVTFDEQSGYELYVDQNRDRIIEKRERIEGTGPTRTCQLDTELSASTLSDDKTIAPTIRHLTRTVTFRKSFSWDRIGFATLGFMEGQVDVIIDGQARRVTTRQVDATADGLFNGSKDRIWIDIDGNNDWNPITEQFSLQPYIRIAGMRYAVKSNDDGTRFELVANSTSGKIVLTPHVVETGTVTQIKVLLTGDDHSSFALDSLAPIDIPTGVYRVENVEIVVRDGTTGLASVFVFSNRNRRDTPGRVFEVTKDQTTMIDPIGKLDFDLHSDDVGQPGKKVLVTPRLSTEDGLNLTSSFIGVGESPTSNCESSVKTTVTNADGETVFGHESFFW